MSRQPAPGWGDFWNHYDNGTWEPDTRSWIQQLKPGDIFVDIGAWIGPVTLWALERGARVIAVEPDPVAQEHFIRNVGDKAELWKGAVTPHGGFVFIDRATGDSETKIAHDGKIVESWTLEEILYGITPSRVKIDVEGYETTLAPAIIPWLGQNKIPIQVSLHGEILDRDLFNDYEYVDWPAGSWGDVRAYNNKAEEIYRSRM